MTTKTWMMFGTIAAMATAQAMTYSEFKAAITAAQDGGTVVLDNDVTYDSALPSISKRITITSPAGATNTLLRASSYTGILLNMGDAAADITLSNIAIDGNKTAGRTGRAIGLTAGRLTLGAGAAIRNFDFGYNTGGIYVATDGVFVMDEGSEISGCDYGSGAHFAMILLGNRSAQLAAGVAYRQDSYIVLCKRSGRHLCRFFRADTDCRLGHNIFYLHKSTSFCRMLPSRQIFIHSKFENFVI